MSQIESQRKHISKTCICKKEKKKLYQELTLNLVPSAKPALQGKKLFNPSNTNASNFIFSLSLSLYLLNNEAENVGITFSDAESLGGWPVSL